MKKTFSLFLCLFVSLAMMAANVTEEQAAKAARQFLSKRPQMRAGQMRMAKRQPLLLSPSQQEATAYYVFNVDGGQGYVVVSGSTLTPQILGYSSRGAFDADQLPEQMRTWMDDYARQIAYAEQTQGRHEAPRMMMEHDAIAPLISSRWNQGSPYNKLCPIDPSTSQRSVTGCVATALAQVLYYYKYPAQTLAPIPAYTTQTQSISMKEMPVTTIDWSHMVDIYTGSETATQQQAVAQLMALCGQAVQMDYNSQASGASGLRDVEALQTYFGYDATVRIVERNAFSTLSWNELIYQELAEGRPVIYNGSSVGGGHSFIVDGYDGNGFYHINWGWGGHQDDYFLLSVLNPEENAAIGASNSSDGYSFGQTAIVGIQHSTGEVIPARMSCFRLENTGSDTYTRSKSTDDFSGISLSMGIFNFTGMTHEFLAAAVLENAEGEILSMLGGFNIGSLKNYYGYNNATLTDISFGADLPDGIYYIVPASTSEGSDTWEECWGAINYRIKAEVSGNTLTLTNPTVALTGEISLAGDAFSGHKVRLTANITNRGTVFNDYIYLLVDNKLAGGRMFEIAESDTEALEIDFMAESKGRKNVALAYVVNDEYVPFAATTIDVQTFTGTTDLNYSVTLLNATDGVVDGDKVEASVSVSNAADDYYDNVVMWIMKYDPSDQYYHSTDYKANKLSLAKGASTTLNYTFENLEPAQQYLLTFSYAKDGQYVDKGNYAFFSTAEKQPEQKGDVNGDGMVDVFDIVALANIIMSQK